MARSTTSACSSSIPTSSSAATTSSITARSPQGRLVINRCGDCGYWIYPHRPICPECLSWNVKPEEVSGLRHGLHVHPAPPAARSASHIMEPVPVAAVELVEQKGLRYLVADRQLRARRDRPRHAGAADLARDGEPSWPAFEPLPPAGATLMARNPLQDQVAVVGVGSTAYGRDLQPRISRSASRPRSPPSATPASTGRRSTASAARA